MGFADQYLLKQQPGYLFNVSAPENTGICLVIPCFNEKNLPVTFESLNQCFPPEFPVCIIVVINSSAASAASEKEQNKKTLEEAKQWVVQHANSHLYFNLLHVPDIPEKYAGVGFARKIGMDAAVRFFNQRDKKDGVIVNLDADCTVDRNYFHAIETAFAKKREAECATIYFEHQLTENGVFNEGISKYELHLRYYTGFLRQINYPYSYFTIGSCFAVKAFRYISQGGMNRKKAGEDFYFLHKIFPAGKTIEINDTTVHPASRISSRVPFGTGAAMKKFVEMKEDIFTYHPEAYERLEKLILQIPAFFQASGEKTDDMVRHLPEVISSFLLSMNVVEKVSEINRNTGSLEAFIKRFYSWFDAFLVVKYLNYSTDFFDKIPVLEAAAVLGSKMETGKAKEVSDLLQSFRDFQRKNNYISPL